MVTITESGVNDYNNSRNISSTIASFFQEYRVGQALRKSNAYKSKGVPVISVLSYLVGLVFTKKSMYMNILNGTNSAGFARDVVYRLLNATFINWSTFLLTLAAAVIANIAALTGEKRLNALIVDDTMYERLRSKKVELLANVHDHAAKSKNKALRHLVWKVDHANEKLGSSSPPLTR